MAGGRIRRPVVLENKGEELPDGSMDTGDMKCQIPFSDTRGAMDSFVDRGLSDKEKTQVDSILSR